MCGICGFVGRHRLLDEQTLLAMNARIERRGPDGAGHFFAGDVGLAMRRLAIIDLGGGQQPIFNEDRSVCVVFNGEIYNYRQLRKDLLAKGHRFASDSDTEVIVHLYEEHGSDLVKYLDGMFAFALWDTRERVLTLARDRLGIKPLFYARAGEAVLFGSEIKSLLATEATSRALDLQAIDEFLAYTNIPGERTIYEGIRQVLPGHLLRVSADGTIESQCYWTLPCDRAEQRSESEWIDECEAGLRRAVEAHLVADVPVGAFLSGGVDSGLMVAFMADILARPVEAFTVGFGDAGSSFIDERRYARELAARYRLNYHEIDVAPHLDEIICEIVDAFDQPFADDSVVPSYYIAQATVKHVKVALTGLGGDELFGGYKRHLGLLMGERYRRTPGWMRERLIRPMVNLIPEARNSSDSIDHLKRFVRASNLPAPQRYQDSMSALSPLRRRDLYVPSIGDAIDQQATQAAICDHFEADIDLPLLERALRTDLRTYLVDDILTLTDRLSMWHSLELRVPYLDHHFVELVGRVPPTLKIRRGTQKYLLKRIAERWLPKEMIYHRKQGFEAPMGRWLRGPLLGFFDATLNPESVERTGLFNYAAIRRLRDEHVSRKAKHSKVLFSLMMFQLWFDRAFRAH